MINFISRFPNNVSKKSSRDTRDVVTVTETSIECQSSPLLQDSISLKPTVSRSAAKRRQPWKPLTQQTYFLVTVIFTSIGIIALLQVFLLRSNRNNGIIFGPNVNKLPAGQTFCYLYLPTVISLLISFTWTWIDLDVKRLQPFWQLSQQGGARGKDSVLLHYPFDFVASVPVKAAKRRHWPVLSASLAVVIVFWGLTPFQSSIFATKTVVRTSVHPLTLSTSYLSSEEQNTLLTGSYTQSVYNIAWLNETLRPFMSREAMLAPFGFADEPDTIQSEEDWTAPTWMYSVDIDCYDAIDGNVTWDSLNGCHYNKVNLDIPTDIRHDQYISTYVGFWYEESEDSYLLSGPCDMSANHTFLLQWARGNKDPDGMSFMPQPIAATTLYCEPSYYQQAVNATVVPPLMSVTHIIPTGEKQPIPTDIFNVTNFEMSMSADTEVIQNRGDYPPTEDWPDATERLGYLDLARRWDYLPGMTGFAIAAYQRPAPDYMDADLLKDSYQAAYRLLLARRLADILSADLDTPEKGEIVRTYQTQAVVLVPTFVYVVEALVGVTTLIACILLGLSYKTANRLQSDPANLASMMALVAEDTVLCQQLGLYDHASSEAIDEAFEESTFAILDETQHKSVRGHGLKLSEHPSGERSVPRTILSADRLLPKELSWISGTAFFVMQVGIAIALLYTFIRSKRENGIPLPSASILVNQLVENYVPMVVAAFFEPVWTVLNRLICMLQPYEQLRKGNAVPSESLTVDYASLPPQAVIGRALRAGHGSLAMLCTMVILANVLSVAFNSIFFEDTIRKAIATTFEQPYQFPLNGTTIGNDSFAIGKPYYDPFYIAMTNLTAGTALPTWTDETFFYLPFNNQSLPNSTDTTIQATTHAISASLHCVSLAESGQNRYSYHIDEGFAEGVAPATSVNATMTFPGTTDSCHVSTETGMRPTGPHGNVALELLWFDSTNNDSTVCNNIIIAGWLRSANTSSTWYSAKLGRMEQSFIACRPEVHINHRKLTVNMDGMVLSSEIDNGTVGDTESMFQPSNSSFVASVHRVFSQWDDVLGPTWHNDSFPSDFWNYLMTTARNSTDFLDPSLSPPSYDQTASALSTLYAKMFAIVLGTNVQKILQPTERSLTTGSSINSETRIFVSEPMFIMSMTVLVLYLLSTVVLYVSRPWKILPRMPTTIASQIAFFGASHAVEDLEGTTAMTVKQRNIYLQNLGIKYGFGRFLGVDGKAHVGIEREPLVQVLKKDDLRMQDNEEEKDKGAAWVQIVHSRWRSRGVKHA